MQPPPRVTSPFKCNPRFKKDPMKQKKTRRPARYFFAAHGDVIWFSAKALPSLHCFVNIVVQFTPTRPKNPKCASNHQKSRKEKLQEKLLGKWGAIIELFMNNLVLYLFQNKILISVVHCLSVAM